MTSPLDKSLAKLQRTWPETAPHHTTSSGKYIVREEDEG
jgi:hypothetical protein